VCMVGSVAGQAVATGLVHTDSLVVLEGNFEAGSYEEEDSLAAEGTDMLELVDSPEEVDLAGRGSELVQSADMDLDFVEEAA